MRAAKIAPNATQVLRIWISCAAVWPPCNICIRVLIFIPDHFFLQQHTSLNFSNHFAFYLSINQACINRNMAKQHAAIVPKALIVQLQALAAAARALLGALLTLRVPRNAIFVRRAATSRLLALRNAQTAQQGATKSGNKWPSATRVPKAIGRTLDRAAA